MKFVTIVILALVIMMGFIVYNNRSIMYMWFLFFTAINKGDRGVEQMVGGLLRFQPSTPKSRVHFLKRLEGLKKRLKKHHSKISEACFRTAMSRIKEKTKECQLINY